MKKIVITCFFLIGVFFLCGRNALYFDGADDKIIVADSADDFPALFTNLGNKMFTIEFWVKIYSDTQNATRIIDIKHDANEYVSIIYYNQKIYSSVKSTSYSIKNNTIDNNILHNKWYHVKLKWDNSTGSAKLYINDELQSSNGTDITSGANNHFFIGTRTTSGSYFHGYIDEFRIWSGIESDWLAREKFPDELSGSESNLYLYYDMEGFYGDSGIEDRSVNNFHGSCIGMAPSSFVENDAWQGGYRCLLLDGSYDYIKINNDPLINPSAYTFIFWMQPVTLSDGAGLFSKGSDGYHLSISLSDTDYTLTFNNRTAQNLSLEVDRWYCVAAIHSALGDRLYVNGEELELTGTGNYEDNEEPLYLGKKAASCFQGKIDEFQIYNAALERSEIELLSFHNYYNHSNLVAWFECNRFDGGILYDSAENLSAYLCYNNQDYTRVVTGYSSKWINHDYSTWTENSLTGLNLSIITPTHFQTRTIESNGTNPLRITVDDSFSPGLEAGLIYQVANNMRTDSSIIFPEDLPENFAGSPIVVWQDNSSFWSGGLQIGSVNISGSSLLVAHNGHLGTTSEGIAEVSIDYRLSRVWYFEREGAISGVTLDFDIAEICGQQMSLGSPSDYQLLHKSEPENSFVIKSGELSLGIVNGTILSFTGTALDSPEGYYTIGAVNNAPLPATLASFTGYWTGDACHLNWETLSEINVCGWNVYRGDAISPQLQVNPTLIEGAGTSTQSTHYSFTDEYGDYTGSFCYYWLESISLLGLSELHGPVMIDIPEEDSHSSPEVPLFPGMIIYPNPFNPNTQVVAIAPVPGTYSLILYNLKGQKVMTIAKDHFLEAHKQYYFQLNCDDAENPLGSGIYFIRFMGSGIDVWEKILLVK